MKIEITFGPAEISKMVQQHLIAQGFRNPKVVRVLTGSRVTGYGPCESEEHYFDGVVCSVEPPVKP